MGCLLRSDNDIIGLVQDCGISIADAIEISCISNTLRASVKYW